MRITSIPSFWQLNDEQRAAFNRVCADMRAKAETKLGDWRNDPTHYIVNVTDPRRIGWTVSQRDADRAIRDTQLRNKMDADMDRRRIEAYERHRRAMIDDDDIPSRAERDALRRGAMRRKR
jgi:hypothetical protein